MLTMSYRMGSFNSIWKEAYNIAVLTDENVEFEFNGLMVELNKYSTGSSASESAVLKKVKEGFKGKVRF